MKIVIIGTAYPFRGGLASYNERLARQFMDEGESVEIVTFKLQYPRLFFPGKTQYSDGRPPKGLSITRLLSSINPFSWIRTARAVAALKPQFVVVKYWHPSMSPSFGSVNRMIKRIRPETGIICIFDNVIPHEGKFGYNLLTRYFTGSIDASVVMSESVASDLKRFRTDIPVKFNPHPVFDNYGDPVPRERAVTQLGWNTDWSVILFFGFIRAYKGLDLLLKAFADKRLRGRNFKLVVAGEFYEDESPYLKIVADNHLEEEVLWMNRYIEEDEVAYLFSACNLVVQPYKSATQSGVTQIAYHFGKPMVVTDVGGLSEIVPKGKCGYVVDPDPGNIADAIDDYFGNDRESEFVQGVEDERKKYGWDRMTSTLRECYELSIEEE